MASRSRLAGIWESWRAGKSEIERTFAIITMRPNAEMAPLRNRCWSSSIPKVDIGPHHCLPIALGRQLRSLTLHYTSRLAIPLSGSQKWRLRFGRAAPVTRRWKEAAGHVEQAHKQVQDERAPCAVHEGVDDLEHARDQQHGANEDDAGDREPGDNAEHDLHDAVGITFSAVIFGVTANHRRSIVYTGPKVGAVR
jgi:hypothetical protein